MAGQGLNLGLQDVSNLADVVERAAASGMDPVTFLAEYERSRKAQVSLTLSGIHALHEMFGVQHTKATCQELGHELCAERRAGQTILGASRMSGSSSAIVLSKHNNEIDKKKL
jgi:2-polyprenyl-6-methoxyphenol hydroxylase-like FAD-dependent oxidoreductase